VINRIVESGWVMVDGFFGAFGAEESAKGRTGNCSLFFVF
jgi:hypothetical protein